MNEKLKHEDVAAVAEILELPQWKTMKKLNDNYVWALRKYFDDCASPEDMYFKQGEIAGVKSFITRMEAIAKRAKRKEAKDVQED